MKYLKTFENYQIYEIFNSEVKPNIVKEFFDDYQRYQIWIKIDDDVYIVYIDLVRDKELKNEQKTADNATLRVDFSLKLPEKEKVPNAPGTFTFDMSNEYDAETSIELTNKGNAIKVLENVLGSVLYWASKDIYIDLVEPIPTFRSKLKDVTIKKIWIAAKSETKGDDRRSKMYDLLLKKFLTKKGIKIISEKEIYEEYLKKYRPDLTQDTAIPEVMKEYIIEPIKISQLT